MAVQIRSGLKKAIPQKFWPFFRYIDKYVVDVTYMYLVLRRYIQKRNLKLVRSSNQSVKSYAVSILFDDEQGGRLEESLTNCGAACFSGRHSVYVPDSGDIDMINGDIRGCYPAGIGLKIIKSREISPDTSPYYTSKKLAPASTEWSMRAVGSMAEKMAVSNLLSTSSFAPKVYDLVRLEAPNGQFHYAFIVENINGAVVTGIEGEKFISDFKEKLSDYGMETVSIAEHCDLRPPDFRNNIIGSKNGPRYVDIQNFVLARKQQVHQIREDARAFLRSTDQSLFESSAKCSDDVLEDSRYYDLNESLLKILSNKGILPGCSFFLLGEKAVAGLSPYLLNAGVLWCHFLEKEMEAYWKWLYLNGYSRFSGADGLLSATRNFMLNHPECKHRVFLTREANIDEAGSVLAQCCDVIIVLSGDNNRPQVTSELGINGFSRTLSEKILKDPGGTVVAHLFEKNDMKLSGEGSA